jgi:LuxR family maltose regulon positive regulatory protein
MKIGTKTLQQSIASNKFYPPRINKSQSLQRYNIITERLGSSGSLRKIIVIEAQAGQGKTTLAYQYLDHGDHPFIWYQIGSEDSDSVLFLSALHFSLSKRFSEYTSPQLAAILEEGQIGPMDFRECINILLHDLDRTIRTDIFIVFDDLHLISKSGITNQLLDYLIDTSPPQLHFILTSRQRLKLQAQLLTRASMPLYLDTEDLALGLQDIETLYEIVFETNISRKEAEKILQETNGWVMGIVLAAHPFAQKGVKTTKDAIDGDKQKLINEKKDGYILNYFEEEIFSHVSEALHDAFLQLSFLDEVDVNLAREMTKIDDIDGHLDKMADENFFVYRLDDDRKVFRFHHLFQEFLQIKSKQELGDDGVQGIYCRIADYYLAKDLIEKALKPLRNGQDYFRMETVMKRWGLQLVANNRTRTILGILQSIPEETLLRHTWLAFFYGLLATDTSPRHTLPYFETCRTQFAQNNDEAGELMSLSQIIYFHFVISGRYHLGSMLLQRTQTLFERNHQNLPVEITIIVARNLAAAYCFFDGKMEQAHHYAKLGYELAKKRESGNFIAATRFILGYIALLSGDRRSATHEIENSLYLASNPLVGMSNRLTLHIMQLCELSMHGDSAGFRHQKELIQASVDENIVRQTVAAPYLFIWSSIELISRGRMEQAIETLNRGMSVSKSASSDHMTSQFLQWRAFAHSITGNREQALKDIETSTSLRNESGGPFYISYNCAIAGASLVNLGILDQATTLLEKGLATAKNIPSPYVEACCSAYLALIAVKRGDQDSSVEAVSNWLRIMKNYHFTYFWGWEPYCTEQLLCTAVKHGIETEFAKTCAEKRNGISISSDGTATPLLDIQVIGDFSISLRGKIILTLKDLSALQRELIGLLISSPGLSVGQEQIQLAFWPDNAPDKARNSLDTLTHRLRKVLKERLPVPATCYFVVGKGFLQLINVRVDAIQFVAHARNGLKLAKQELWWQAGNAFINAFSFWKDFTLTEFFMNDQALIFYDDLLDTMRLTCLTWSDMLVRHNRFDEALTILEKSAKILAQDDDCVALRYQLYLKKNAPLKARDVLSSYRQELLKLGYSEKEADEMIGALTNKKTFL